jgi:beta-glucanase (GH16 family)
MKHLSVALLLFVTSFLSSQTLKDDFEGSGNISTWLGDDCDIDKAFTNPFSNSYNSSATVLKYADIGGQFANIRFDTSSNLDLSTKSTFSIKIYVSSADITGNQTNKVSLKLQNNTLGEPWVTQTEIVKTISLDQWQTVEFDFKNDGYLNFDSASLAPITRTDLNRVLIQVNGEGNNDHVTAYIDDFLLKESSTNNNNSGTDPVFDNLVWSDEFNGTGAIDTNKWHHQTRPIINGVDWANGEIQHYTDKNTNSFMANGALKILAKKETYTNEGVTKQYTSARLNSKFAFTYGKVEIRAKMPFGVGTFPALWMLGQNITETGGYWAASHGTTGWPDCGEVDIIEHWGDNQDFVQSAMHNRASFGGTVNKGGRTISNASTEFHIYTLDWNSDKMTFSVDGIVHYTYNPENKNQQNWPYSAPQYLLFNVAILPNIASNFTESSMEIDYVRVYQESTASVLDIESVKKINVFPNPVNDTLSIKITDIDELSKAVLYSLSGKKIHSFNQNSTLKKHDISFLKKGIYILKIETKSKPKYFKVIKN